MNHISQWYHGYWRTIDSDTPREPAYHPCCAGFHRSSHTALNHAIKALRVSRKRAVPSEIVLGYWVRFRGAKNESAK